MRLYKGAAEAEPLRSRGGGSRGESCNSIVGVGKLASGQETRGQGSGLGVVGVSASSEEEMHPCPAIAAFPCEVRPCLHSLTLYTVHIISRSESINNCANLKFSKFALVQISFG